MAHIAPYQMPDFEQSPEFGRPMTLLTKDTKRDHLLTYRYDDTGEMVRVPNVPCNQTVRTRIETLDYYLEVGERCLEAKLNQPWLKGSEREWTIRDHKATRERVLAIRAKLAAQPNLDVPVIF